MTAQQKAAGPGKVQAAPDNDTDNPNLNEPHPPTQDQFSDWFHLGDRARMAAKKKRQRERTRRAAR